MSALPCVLCVSVEDGSCESSGSSSSTVLCVGVFAGVSLRRRNDTYAFTNAEGLNFGKHMGNQDADAEELIIEGEWMVLIKTCRSIQTQSIRCSVHAKTNQPDG